MDMKNETPTTEATLRYSAAHRAHYTAKDLHRALELYKRVIAAHPETREALWSHKQIQHIVRTVVPRQENLDGPKEPIGRHLEQDESPELRQRRDLLDDEWDDEQRERREAETDRRVKEPWRGHR